MGHPSPLPLTDPYFPFCFSNLLVQSVFITACEFSWEWQLYNVLSLQPLLPSPFPTDLNSHTWRNGPLGAMLFALGSMKLVTSAPSPPPHPHNFSKKSMKTCLMLFLFLVPSKILSLKQLISILSSFYFTKKGFVPLFQLGTGKKPQ